MYPRRGAYPIAARAQAPSPPVLIYASPAAAFASFSVPWVLAYVEPPAVLPCMSSFAVGFGRCSPSAVLALVPWFRPQVLAYLPQFCWHVPGPSTVLASGNGLHLAMLRTCFAFLAAPFCVSQRFFSLPLDRLAPPGYAAHFRYGVRSLY